MSDSTDKEYEQALAEEIAMEEAKIEEIEKKFESQSIFDRIKLLLRGLKAPAGSREYKEALIEMQRLLAPVGAVVIPLIFIAILFVCSVPNKSNRDLTDEGLRVFREEMRIRTDLDLRNPKYHTVLGADVNHVVRPVGSYHRMLASPKGRHTVAETLRVFADEKNYPVYVHCAGGADRTGSIIFLLEGICGVSEADLSIEYELTSFGGLGGYRQRFDHSYHFASLVALMKERPGATLSEQIRSYVKTELGLTDDEIATIRRMLVAPACYCNDVVLESGGKRLAIGLDGRIKPSNVPFLSVVGQDGEAIGCISLADDAHGDLYFSFPVKRSCVVVGTEELPDGFAFPIRSSTFKDARIVLADEAMAVLGTKKGTEP